MPSIPLMPYLSPLLPSLEFQPQGRGGMPRQVWSPRA